MARIPMTGDPSRLKELVAKYSAPNEKILQVHRDVQSRLAAAEAEGNQAEAKALRALLKRTQKLIED